MSIVLFPAVRSSLNGLVLSLFLISSAFAQDPASQQLRDQQSQFRQLEQQQRLEQWQRRSQSDAATAEEAPRPVDTQCWRVAGVSLTGHQRLTSKTLEASVQPLLRECMGPADINALLKAITERYVQAGYPTSRPYLARPPAAGKPLRILIVEGFVESIELADPDLPLSLHGAFPDLLGQPLHLPDLEQGLDQLNRLRAYDLGVDLLPGERLGGTRVLIQPQRIDSRWHLDSRYDNRGSESSGQHRFNLSLGLDSPLGLNDYLHLSFNTSLAEPTGPRRGQGHGLFYNIPYGPWTFSLSASEQGYRFRLPPTRLISSGQSTFHGLGIERLLWRNQRGMLSASVRLDRKQLVNYIIGADIRVQSPTLTTVDTGLNLLWLDNGLWNAQIGASQGLDWFGADRPAANPRIPRPQFRKYRASLLRLRQGPVQQPWRWQSELNLQYSQSLLPAIEQLALSDNAAVRGFRQYTVSGASAAVWRNTFGYTLPASWPSSVQIHPSLGIDLGWNRFTRDSPWQRLAGASVGVQLSLPHSQLRFDYQRALHASDRRRTALEPGFWVMEWTLNI